MSTLPDTNMPSPRHNEHFLQDMLDKSLNGIVAFRSMRDDQHQIFDFECVFGNRVAADLLNYEQLSGTHFRALCGETRFIESVEFIEHSTDESFEYNDFYTHASLKAWTHVEVTRLNDGFFLTLNRTESQEKRDTELVEIDHFFALALDLVQMQASWLE